VRGNPQDASDLLVGRNRVAKSAEVLLPESGAVKKRAMFLKSLYITVAKAAQNKKHVLFVDVFVTGFAAYLGFQKALGWSLTAWLSKIFRPEMAEGVVLLLIVLCIYAAIAKVFLLIVTAFPATRVVHSDGEPLAQCFLTINREIRDHLANITRDSKAAVRSFLQNHKFQNNVAYFTDNLATHIRSVLSGAVKKDIFVSVYMVPRFETLEAPRDRLTYICHSPHSSDGINSREIIFTDGAHSQYECVKCIKGSLTTHLKLNCSDYYRAKVRRHKTVRHYFGLKLEYENVLLGFLNIELHNKTFFSSEEEMASFLEENVLAFRYVIEYQFLKRTFFAAVRPHLKEEA